MSNKRDRAERTAKGLVQKPKLKFRPRGKPFAKGNKWAFRSGPEWKGNAGGRPKSEGEGRARILSMPLPRSEWKAYEKRTGAPVDPADPPTAAEGEQAHISWIARNGSDRDAPRAMETGLKVSAAHAGRGPIEAEFSVGFLLSGLPKMRFMAGAKVKVGGNGHQGQDQAGG